MRKDKNEELQDYLNDNRYIQLKDIMVLYSCSQWVAWSIFRKNNIKPIKTLYLGSPNGLRVFYDKIECDKAFAAKEKQRLDWLLLQKENKLIDIKELAKIFERSVNAMRVYLIKRDIRPVKSQKGVGRTRVLYDKNQCLSLIDAIKSKEEKLQQMLTDERYIQFDSLVALYKHPAKTIRSKLWRNNVKPVIHLRFHQKSFAFYDKELCLAVIDGRVKTPRTIKTIDVNIQQEVNSWIEDSRYVQVSELQYLWGVRLESVWNILSLNKIKPAKRFQKGIRACFYSRAKCKKARPFVV